MNRLYKYTLAISIVILSYLVLIKVVYPLAFRRGRSIGVVLFQVFIKHKRALNLNSFSIAVIISLVAYYVIIIFHRNEIVIALAASGTVLTTAIYLFSLTLLPMIVKTGLIYRRDRYSQPTVRRTVIAISFYTIAVLGAVFGVYGLALIFSRLLSSEYWAKTHWLWVGIILFVLLSLILLRLKNFGLINWQMLREMKAVPIVSPVFCFGGPVLWSKNLEYMSLDKNLLSTYSTLSIISGIIFLIYLCLFAVFNQMYETSQSKDDSRFELFDIHERLFKSHEKTWPTNLCVAVGSVGLYLFLLVLLDVLLVLTTHL